MTNRYCFVRTALLACLGLVLLGLPLAGQERGARLAVLLLTEDGSAPVEGAHIRLVDASEVLVGEALSDGRGTFSLPMPEPGIYRLRVTRIGYQSWASDTLHVAPATESRALRLHVPVEPIPLPELFVPAQNDCATTAEERRRGFALYRSVLPILATVSNTADLGTLRMQVIRPIVVWKRGGRHYVRDTSVVVTGRSLDNASPEQLVASGYAEAVDSMTAFYAPDGDALAAPGFLATHCIWPVESEDEATVGLGFEPKPGRELVDVKGVLWIDTVAGGPRELEFQYTSLRPFLRRHLLPELQADMRSRFNRVRFRPIEIHESWYGGELHFQHIAGDRWLIHEWQIRHPTLVSRGEVGAGRGATVMPLAHALESSGRVLALIPP